MPRKTPNKSKTTARRPGPRRSPANTPRLKSIPSRNKGVKGGFSKPEPESEDFDENALADEDRQLLDSLVHAQETMLPPRSVDPARVPTLAEFMEKEQIFLNQLFMGVHPHIAAAMEGVPRSVFDNWMTVGKRDYESDNPEAQNSLEARLYGSVYRKIAERRALAETTIATQNQMEYLRRGAGRMLGDEWIDLREMVIADKAGLITKDGSPQVGGHTIVTVQTIEQVLNIYNEYRIGQGAASNAADSTIDAPVESVRVEQVVKDREEITLQERPPVQTPEPTGLDLAAIRRLQG